jgi:uroporphyrinogen-III synthase
MRVIVTRPEEDAATLRRVLESRGHEVIQAPVLSIVARAAGAIAALPWQAIAVTSANGIRALANAHHLKAIPVLTVGPQSLAAARQAGFTRCEAHGGDVDGLVRHIAATLSPSAGPILYPSGAATSGDLGGKLTEAGFHCRRVIVYDAMPATELALSADTLAASEAVFLYSPRSARLWRDLVERQGLGAAASCPVYLCLSANVAAQLPQHWRRQIAQSAEESAMLALLDQLERTR